METQEVPMQSRRTFLASSLLLATTSTLALAGCSAGSGGSDGGAAVTIGMPNGSQTNNSNPFVATSSGRSLGYTQVIYEPLADWNSANPAADPTPRLAESWTWNEDYTQIELQVRQGVKWTDGKDLTADDVAYSFQMRKDNDALNGDALSIDKVEVNGQAVTVTFSESEFINAQKVLGTFIVPEHIWKDIADPTTDLNQAPVGSGPFVLKNWTNQAVTLEANPDYWGGKPAVPQLRYTSYNDNSALTTALVNGDVQWGWTFIADFENVYIAKDEANHVWYPTNLGVDALFLNTTRAPFNDPAMRKAVAMVIDREVISQQASSGGSPATTSVTGLPSPAGDDFVADEFKDQHYTPDVEGAKKVLSDAGYTLDGDTLKDKDGNPVSFTLTDPSGWADYLAALQIIAENVKQLGISATVDAINQDTWVNNVATGEFDAVLHWTDSGSTPWNLYANTMDGAFLKPVGESATWNYGRFESEEATAALATYATASSDEERASALAQVQKIFVEQVPVIVTTARPAFGEYSTKYYEGWPSEDDPYMTPDPTQFGSALILTRLTPVAK